MKPRFPTWLPNTLLIVGLVASSIGYCLLVGLFTIRSSEQISGALETHLLNDRSLAKTLRRAINQQATETEDVGPGIMLTAVSFASVEQFEQITTRLLPMDWSRRQVNSQLGEVFAYLQDDTRIPRLGVDLTPLRQRVRQHAPFLLRWIQDRIDPPMADEATVRRYASGQFGDALAPLLMSRVPANLEPTYWPHAVSLFRTIADSEIPSRISAPAKLVGPRLATLRARLLTLKAFAWTSTVSGIFAIAFAITLGRNVMYARNAALGISAGLFLPAVALGSWLPTRLPELIRNSLADTPRAAQHVFIDLILTFTGQTSIALWWTGSAALGFGALFACFLVIRRHAFGVHEQVGTTDSECIK